MGMSMYQMIFADGEEGLTPIERCGVKRVEKKDINLQKIIHQEDKCIICCVSKDLTERRAFNACHDADTEFFKWCLEPLTKLPEYTADEVYAVSAIEVMRRYNGAENNATKAR